VNTRGMTEEQYDEWSDARGNDRDESPIPSGFCPFCGGGGCAECDWTGEVGDEGVSEDDLPE
jgi:hypothetical protein